MNLMDQLNRTTMKALAEIEGCLDGTNDSVQDKNAGLFAVKAAAACAGTRNSISKQVDVAVRAAVATKAQISELRPAFELLVGATSQT